MTRATTNQPTVHTAASIRCHDQRLDACASTSPAHMIHLKKVGNVQHLHNEINVLLQVQLGLHSIALRAVITVSSSSNSVNIISSTIQHQSIQTSNHPKISKVQQLNHVLDCSLGQHGVQAIEMITRLDRVRVSVRVHHATVEETSKEATGSTQYELVDQNGTTTLLLFLLFLLSVNIFEMNGEIGIRLCIVVQVGEV